VNPSWTDIVTAIATSIAALGVGIAIVGAYLSRNQLREARDQVREAVLGRHVDIAIDISRRWDEDGMLDARQALSGLNPEDVRDLFEVLLASGKEDQLALYYRLQRVGNYFEDLAVLWKYEGLKIEWIDDTVGGAAIQYWNRWRLSVSDSQTGQPTLYKNWANLAAALVAYRAAGAGEAGPAPSPT
jgi:hypothetical protein